MPKKTEPTPVSEHSRLDEVLDILGVPSWQRSPLKVNYNAKCPIHNDRHASLSVGRKQDSPAEIGLHCHAGCDARDLYNWFEKPSRWFQEPRGWTLPVPRASREKGQPVEVYPYCDLTGTELYRQTRFVAEDGSKKWMIEHFVDKNLKPGKGGTPDVLYNWSAVEAGIGTGVDEIYVVEGEKDVETLRAWERVGTTALSGNWSTELVSRLAGARLVTVVADRDQKGYEQAHTVAQLLEFHEVPYRVVQAAVRTVKADITDHLRGGYRLDELEVIEDVEALALERKIQEEMLRVKIRDEARRRVSAEAHKPIPAVISVTEMLAAADEEETYRVDRLWPTEGHILLSAQYKAGKTTLRDNWIKAQVDEHQFLNLFEITPLKGRIGVLDFEMGDRKNRRHLRQMGLTNPDAVDFLDMRGAASSLNMLDAGRRREWVSIIKDQNWETVVLDPVSPALVSLGLDENSNKDVRTFLNAWEEMLAEAGVYESLVIHHSGHSGDRSRGAAAFRDWPSAYWDLNRERDKEGNTDDTAPSYFKAKGRDVDFRESELQFERTTLSLTVKEEGVNRKTKRQEQTQQARTERVAALYKECKQWLETGPERVTMRAFIGVASGSDADKQEAYRMAEAAGDVARHIAKASKAPRRRSEDM